MSRAAVEKARGWSGRDESKLTFEAGGGGSRAGGADEGRVDDAGVEGVDLAARPQGVSTTEAFKKLTDALSLTLAELFTLEWQRPAGPFFGAAELSEIGGAEVSPQMVPAGVPDAKLQVLHERYPPGSDTGSELLSHPGEEAGVVVRGAVRVTVGGQERVLRAGDAYYFDSRIPHRFTDASDEACELVSASTPRSF